MDDALPSITSAQGTVGSRFVSQGDIDDAKARRDEQWRAAYARLGQEPPPQPTEDVYDGRSLAEKLAANKIAKQEEWEEKTKLANQFRALEEDEVQFLDTIRDEQTKNELKRKREDAEEVKGFMAAVAARNTLPDKPPTSTSPPNGSSATASNSKGKVSPTMVKKPTGAKNALKGVVVKKKPAKPPASTTDSTPAKKVESKEKDPKASKSADSDTKRPRLSSSD
ncbi:uncharacterized protein FOMMEDRAFT_82308 [Fomitiporia mediterranea MF3/22]|uniref:uncharacterized protein n=1 Tax=Fomitiporia mediterranea (strain MF3/22) TaxID=694068 RepID=UPI0004408FD3|nr:uncharacterized protein FOMMEDRAFT_82308 [Fomitiporia mediterranea MF3/22]EJD03840.1 hypothetical protein FOMMEDRAFT_82308 [Fomitiporia mediterranea MF3/22]